MKKVLTRSIFILFMILCFFQKGYAQSPQAASAKVIKILGNVTLNGKLLTKDYLINESGELVTGEKSFVQIRVEKWRNVITVAPKSKMLIDFNSVNKYLFDEGSCRWASDKQEKDNKAPSAIQTTTQRTVSTHYASMAIRGTDFVIKANNALGETEVYMLDGEIEFKNLKDNEDYKTIKAKQWVGIGGRFGQKVSPVLNLPNDIENSIRQEFANVD